MVTPHSYVSTLDSEAQCSFFIKTKTHSQLSINIEIFMLYIHKWISLISSHSETQAALAALEVKCDSSGLRGWVSRDLQHYTTALHPFDQYYCWRRLMLTLSNSSEQASDWQEGLPSDVWDWSGRLNYVSCGAVYILEVEGRYEFGADYIQSVSRRTLVEVFLAQTQHFIKPTFSSSSPLSSLQ